MELQIINQNYFCHVKVINETLRLGNVVRFLHRKALKDVRYRGRIQVTFEWVFSLDFCQNLTLFELFIIPLERVWHSMWMESASGDCSRALGCFAFWPASTVQSVEMAGQLWPFFDSMPSLMNTIIIFIIFIIILVK